jgi:hypothetical protein
VHHVLRVLVTVTSIIITKSLEVSKFYITQFKKKAQVCIAVISPYRSEPLVYLHPLFIFYDFRVQTPVAIYNPKGSCYVKLSIISYFVHIHIKVQRELMFCIKQYTTEYIPAEACDISCVRIYIVLNE